MTPPSTATTLGGARVESKEYFEKRALKKGAVSWVLLMSLGVAYVISGDFSGWNYGIANGGWAGMAIAFVVMGAMYLFMVLGLAEMSSAMPTAGAGYGFARRAMGKIGGNGIRYSYRILHLPCCNFNLYCRLRACAWALRRRPFRLNNWILFCGIRWNSPYRSW